MNLKPLLAPLCASLGDFVLKPMAFVGRSGESTLAILDDNQPVFYVLGPEAYAELLRARPVPEKFPEPEVVDSVLTQGSMRLNRFDALAQAAASRAAACFAW